MRISPSFAAPDYTAAMFGTNEQIVNHGDVVFLDERYGVAHLSTASGIRLLTLGDLVVVEAGYENGGFDDVVYRYLGSNGRVDLSAEDYWDTARWADVGGTPGSVYTFSATGSALIDLNSTNYYNTDFWSELAGHPGSVYEYMGPGGTIDLAIADYTDLGFWKPVTGTELLPNGFNIDQSPSTGLAGIVVLNDVRSGPSPTSRT